LILVWGYQKMNVSSYNCGVFEIKLLFRYTVGLKRKLQTSLDKVRAGASAVKPSSSKAKIVYKIYYYNF